MIIIILIFKRITNLHIFSKTSSYFRNTTLTGAVVSSHEREWSSTSPVQVTQVPKLKHMRSVVLVNLINYIN